MSTAFSGRFGSIEGISQVQNWNIDLTMSDTAQANSYTQAAQARNDGVWSWNGACTFLGKTIPSLEKFTFKGYTGNGSYKQSGALINGDAVLTGLTISGDMTTNARISANLQFAGTGPLLRASAMHEDTLSPDIMRSKECVIAIGDEIVRWKNFSFNLTQSVQPNVDSECVLEDGNVWAENYPAILDATFSVLVPGAEEFADGDAVVSVKVSHSGDDIIDVGFMRYMGMSGLTVDPNTGSLVEHTENFSFTAHDNTGTLGSLSVYGFSFFERNAEVL